MKRGNECDDAYNYDYIRHYDQDRKMDIEDYLNIKNKKDEKKLKKKLKKPNVHQAQLDVSLNLVMQLVTTLRSNPIIILDKEKYALYKQLGYLIEDLADECYSEKLTIE